MVKTNILLSSALALVLVLNTTTQALPEEGGIKGVHRATKRGDFLPPVHRGNVQKSSVGAGAKRKLVYDDPTNDNENLPLATDFSRAKPGKNSYLPKSLLRSTGSNQLPKEEINKDTFSIVKKEINTSGPVTRSVPTETRSAPTEQLPLVPVENPSAPIQPRKVPVRVLLSGEEKEIARKLDFKPIQPRKVPVRVLSEIEREAIAQKLDFKPIPEEDYEEERTYAEGQERQKEYIKKLREDLYKAAREAANYAQPHSLVSMPASIDFPE